MRSNIISVLIAISLSIILNADSFQMIEKISLDKMVRQMIIQSDYIQERFCGKETTGTVANEPPEGIEAIKNSLVNISDIISEYQGLSIGVKWSSTKEEIKFAKRVSFCKCLRD